MQLLRFSLLLAPMFILIGGCDGDAPTPTAGDSGSVQQSPPAKTGPTAAKPQNQPINAGQPGGKYPDPLAGKVKETMDAGGYTYLLLDTPQGEVWVAAKSFAVSVGDQVEVAGLMPMPNFHSRSLDKTFEEIQFVGRAAVIGDQAAAHAQAPDAKSGMPAGHPPLGGAAPAPKAGTAGAPKPGDIETLADGLTVAQLFEKKGDLQGKSVKFRGQVVKVNRGILGKNWLHIQDGSGQPGSNDITVTSKTGYAPQGTIVVIEGTLALDKDFGAGYAYNVIVEDASVTPQPPKADTADSAAGQ